MKTMMRNVLVLWFATMALVGADRIPRMPLDTPHPARYHIHVVNELSNIDMGVHCQSGDNDLGYRQLVNRGDDYQWNFKENFWGTTLFWCKLDKQNAYVSFESFWPESTHFWLRERCGKQGTCIWTAKDDGIYLRNMSTNADEFVHKWIPTK